MSIADDFSIVRTIVNVDFAAITSVRVLNKLTTKQDIMIPGAQTYKSNLDIQGTSNLANTILGNNLTVTDNNLTLYGLSNFTGDLSLTGNFIISNSSANTINGNITNTGKTDIIGSTTFNIGTNNNLNLINLPNCGTANSTPYNPPNINGLILNPTNNSTPTNGVGSGYGYLMYKM